MSLGSAAITLPSSDRDARFLALVEEHYVIITRVVQQYAREAEDRDDLRQEILGQLWRSSDSFAGRARRSTWVYRVAINVAISQHRRRSRHDKRLVQPAEGELERVAAESPEPDERVIALERFLATLGEFDRALLLMYLDDHGHQEIAESLGISATNASTRISRLKQRFKRETSADTIGTEESHGS